MLLQKKYGKMKPKQKNVRKVKQLDLNGDLINIWSTLLEASEKTGTHYTSICNCCRGKIKTANGFMWEYDNSDIKLKSDPLDAFLDFL